LNASLRRKLEEIERTISKMTSKSQVGVPIIVEGRKDEAALKTLRIPGEIICLKARKVGFYDFTTGLAHNSEVTVLTDFDREGARLAAKLTDELTHMKVKVNLTTWKKLKALCRPEIRTVEELASYLERLRRESAEG